MARIPTDKPARTPSRETTSRGAARPAARIVSLMLVAVAGALVVLGASIWFGGAPAGPGFGGPFTLTSGDGRTVSDRDFRGRYMLIYFGYTFCPDVCPTTLQELATALDKLGPKADRVQPIFITVDPQRDTPAVIGQYVKAFTPRLIGLTGTKDQIGKVEQEFRVYAEPVHSSEKGAAPDDYTVNHSSVLYLMGPDGKPITVMAADLPGIAMATKLAPLIE